MRGNAVFCHNQAGRLYKRNILSVLFAAFVLLFFAGCLHPKTDNQASVHKRSHEVMPFDISKTTHIFEMTENGGILQVIAKDPGDNEQIRLIQQHLQHESMRFRSGDFSDPASLHGPSMPGLMELATGASEIGIDYSALQNGGQIAFTTSDTHLLTAIHRWFGAQLSDHCKDAAYR